MKVSVLIGSRNRASVLERCLKSIILQDILDVEVIVLDDGSNAPKEYDNLVKSFNNPHIQLFHSAKPLGVSGSRNKLMDIANGDILFIIDDDAFFHGTDSLSLVLETFSINPDVGIVATKIKNHSLAKEDYRVPFSVRSLRKDPSLIDTGRYSSYFLGGAHAIRKEMIEDCSFYNPELFFGEEELDLSYRAISHGWKIYYEPRILVHHVPQPSVVDKGNKTGEELFHHVKNRFYLAYRYLPARYLPSYLGVWLVKYLFDSIEMNALPNFIEGIVEGIGWLRRIKRDPLKPESIRYFRENLGRLWY